MENAPYFARVEALYFQALEEGVSYALKADSSFSLNVQKVKNPDFGYRFGFKLQLGLFLPHDLWELSASFLHLHARTTEEKSGGTFFSTWGYPQLLAEGPLESVSSRWRLHLGFLDLTLARLWPVSRALCLTPYFGLRLSGIRHKLRVCYKEAPLPQIQAEEDISMKNKFWGAGPQVGLLSQFYLTEPVAFFARFATSFLSGDFYIHQDEEQKGNLSAFSLKLLNRFNQIQPISEMAFGLKVCPCFKTKGSNFQTALSWQIYLIPNQNKLVRFTSHKMPGKLVGSLGDLTLQGWALSTSLEF